MWLKECLVGDVSVSFTFAQRAKRYLPTLQSTTTTSDTYIRTCAKYVRYTPSKALLTFCLLVLFYAQTLLQFGTLCHYFI